MTPNNCVFCKIAGGEIPSTPLYRDDEVMVIADIQPKAPVHLLIIPISHQPPSIADLEPGDEGLVGRMVWRAKVMAEERGIAENGYRLVFNIRTHGGQEVDHLHLHLLGGQPLGLMA